MTLNISAISAYLDQCRTLIRDQGHMIQYIQGRGCEPGYAYTVGLTTDLGAELVVFGMEEQAAAALLRGVARRLKECAVADGELLLGIVDRPLRLRTEMLVPDVHRLSVAFALRYFPRYVRIVEWPDRTGKFPGDPGYEGLITQSFRGRKPKGH